MVESVSSRCVVAESAVGASGLSSKAIERPHITNDTASMSDHERLAVEYVRARGISVNEAQNARLYPVANANQVNSQFKNVPALVIPYLDPVTGLSITYSGGGTTKDFQRVRYLQTEAAKGFLPPKKPQRYSQPQGSPVFAYFAPSANIDWPNVLSNPQMNLLIVEGEVKGLSACTHGLATIALGGVFNFLRDGALLPELEKVLWIGRSVYIVFDSDVVDKDEVQLAERRLCAELIRRGAVVHLVRLPALAGFEKTGIDDFLSVRSADDLIKLLENTPNADPGKSLIVEGTDVEVADSVLRDLTDQYVSRAIFTEGEFYIYEETHWRPLPDHQLRSAVLRYDKTRYKNGVKASPTGIIKLSKGRIDSILSIMRDRATEPYFFSAAPAGINCVSGFIVFDHAGCPHLEAHDRKHRQRHCLSGSWEPGASWQHAKLLNTLLRGCFGEDPDGSEKIALVSEICGVAALGIGTSIRAPKAVVAFGPGAENGKSEVLAMLRGLLPPDAVCAVAPTRFNDERMLIKLAGKQLNACDELGSTLAISSDTFKSVVTGEPVMAKELYKPAISFAPTAVHIYATNVLPPFHGGFDRGVQRRLLVLPFNRSIPRGEQIAEIGKRVAAEEMDALLAFAIEGAARVIRNSQFSEPNSCRDSLREWIFSADPVLAWLESRTAYADGHRLPTKQLYSDFIAWAEGEGIRTDRLPGSPNFVSRLLAQDGRITKARDSSTRFIVGLKLQLTQSRWPQNGNIQRGGAPNTMAISSTPENP